MLVLYHARWCPYSRAFLPLFRASEPDSPVPCASIALDHPMDPRWDEHHVTTIPTLVYYEHGEELERLDALRGHGLTRRDLDDLLTTIEHIQDEPQLPKRMHGLRRR